MRYGGKKYDVEHEKQQFGVVKFTFLGNLFDVAGSFWYN